MVGFRANLDRLVFIPLVVIFLKIMQENIIALLEFEFDLLRKL